MDIKKLNDLKIQIENLDKIHHVKIYNDHPNQHFTCLGAM